MKELMHHCQQIRTGFTPKIQDPLKPVRWWSEQDLFEGKIVDSFIIILRTQGCSWALKSGCTMCGYFNDSLWKPISEKDLLTQVETVLKNYNNEPVVKLFTSGSFFDTQEIPETVRNHIFAFLSKKANKISVESRPEYVTKETIAQMNTMCAPSVCEIGIGLETANDVVRDKVRGNAEDATDHDTTQP